MTRVKCLKQNPHESHESKKTQRSVWQKSLNWFQRRAMCKASRPSHLPTSWFSSNASTCNPRDRHCCAQCRTAWRWMKMAESEGAIYRTVVICGAKSRRDSKGAGLSRSHGGHGWPWHAVALIWDQRNKSNMAPQRRVSQLRPWTLGKGTGKIHSHTVIPNSKMK